MSVPGAPNITLGISSDKASAAIVRTWEESAIRIEFDEISRRFGPSCRLFHSCGGAFQIEHFTVIHPFVHCRANITRSPVRALSPAFSLFLALHHCQQRIRARSFCSIFRSSIVHRTSRALAHSNSFSLICSICSSRQQCFKALHLRKVWAPTSSLRRQTRQIGSRSTPLLLIFIRSGKLSCARRQTKCFTFIGHGKDQILSQIGSGWVASLAPDASHIWRAWSL